MKNKLSLLSKIQTASNLSYCCVLQNFCALNPRNRQVSILYLLSYTYYAVTLFWFGATFDEMVFETSLTECVCVCVKYVLLCHFMKSLPLESPIDLSGIAIRGEKGDRVGNECRSTDELRLRVHR